MLCCKLRNPNCVGSIIRLMECQRKRRMSLIVNSFYSTTTALYWFMQMLIMHGQRYSAFFRVRYQGTVSFSLSLEQAKAAFKFVKQTFTKKRNCTRFEYVKKICWLLEFYWPVVKPLENSNFKSTHHVLICFRGVESSITLTNLSWCGWTRKTMLA